MTSVEDLTSFHREEFGPLLFFLHFFSIYIFGVFAKELIGVNGLVFFKNSFMTFNKVHFCYSRICFPFHTLSIPVFLSFFVN